MSTIVLEECGYNSAVLGFSLSYNSSLERAKELLPKYAFGKTDGENKFLRVIQLWIDTDFPRLLLPEMDQYKVATTSLSESTIHTLGKRELIQEDFCIPIDEDMLSIVNKKIKLFQEKKISLLDLKSHLPEGFLQRRVYNINYANLQNIYNQRKNHKIKIWNSFLEDVLAQIEHPEFIVQGFEKNKN